MATMILPGKGKQESRKKKEDDFRALSKPYSNSLSREPQLWNIPIAADWNEKRRYKKINGEKEKRYKPDLMLESRMLINDHSRISGGPSRQESIIPTKSSVKNEAEQLISGGLSSDQSHRCSRRERSPPGRNRRPPPVLTVHPGRCGKSRKVYSW